MIKTLIIENYQSHKDTHLNLDPNVNVIIGQSDKGKSAILRALNWVINNRPIPPKRSRWGGDTIVTIKMKNAIVTRLKTKVSNTYSITSNKQRQDFKAVGVEVPEEIIKIFNINEINIQGQHAAPFLISDSPGAVARQLNTVANLDIIDITMTGIASKARKVDSDHAAAEQNLTELEYELQYYQDLDERERQVKTIEVLSTQVNEAQDTEVGLNNLFAKIYDIQETLQVFQGLKDCVVKITQLDDTNNKVQIIQEQLSNLRRLLYNINTTQRTLKAIHVPDKAELNKLEDIKTKYQVMSDQSTILKDILMQIIEYEKIHNKIAKGEKQVIQELNNLMPDVCPLCGRGGEK